MKIDLGDTVKYIRDIHRKLKPDSIAGVVCDVGLYTYSFVYYDKNFKNYFITEHTMYDSVCRTKALLTEKKIMRAWGYGKERWEIKYPHIYKEKTEWGF